MMRLVGLLALAFMLAGCASHDLEGGGHTQGEKTLTKTCGETATIEGNFGGAGSAEIMVLDGAKAIVYTNNIDGSGGESFKSELTGVPGTWTVTVDFGDGSGYSGGWHVDLDC